MKLLQIRIPTDYAGYFKTEIDKITSFSVSYERWQSQIVSRQQTRAVWVYQFEPESEEERDKLLLAAEAVRKRVKCPMGYMIQDALLLRVDWNEHEQYQVNICRKKDSKPQRKGVVDSGGLVT